MIDSVESLLAAVGDRFETASYDKGTAAYEGALPSYVVGTDWAKASQPQVAPAHYAEPALMTPEPEVATPEVAVYDSPQDLPTRVTPAAWQDEVRQPPRYPSEAGNTPNESDLPPAPATPTDGALG